jgi:hypothetical protein
MKASIRTSATAPDGDDMVGNSITDSMVATAGDGRLAGTEGNVRFSVAFDGQMSAQTELRFQATHLIPGTLDLGRSGCLRRVWPCCGGELQRWIGCGAAHGSGA